MGIVRLVYSNVDDPVIGEVNVIDEETKLRRDVEKVVAW
jgi:hypothetical protein